MADIDPTSLTGSKNALNRVLPFQIEGLDLRGKAVTLTHEFDAIVEKHDYPPVVNRVIGEATALTAVLGSSLKFEGKFILQAQTDGVVDLVVVEYRTPSSMRAYARFKPDALEEAIAAGKTAPHELLGKGALAMTIDQGQYSQRYQGIVSLDGSTLEEVAHQYFRQSEQIPTVMRLAVGELFEGEQTKPRWRVGGLMVQFLPQSEERMRLKDLPGGDGAPDDDSKEDDAWNEARALMDTVSDAELLDPDISSERLLFRLFNEHDIRVYDPIDVVARCSCSRERVADVLDSLEDEARADVEKDGKIVVNCEFCAKTYEFEVGAKA